jgi:hypothetical protein
VKFRETGDWILTPEPSCHKSLTRIAPQLIDFSTPSRNQPEARNVAQRIGKQRENLTATEDDWHLSHEVGATGFELSRKTLD